MTQLTKIVIHWTGGSESLDLDRYHYVVDRAGIVHKGLKPPEANIPSNGKFLREGIDHYVKHCGGGNSMAIGISAVGMFGYDSKTRKTSYPITEIQMEALFAECAKLCKQYNIPITEDTVFTHAEFGRKNPNTSSRGKVDIEFLPYKRELAGSNVGPYIRNKIRWYLDKLGEK